VFSKLNQASYFAMAKIFNNTLPVPLGVAGGNRLHGIPNQSPNRKLPERV